jgi:hypothetical protein
VANDYSKVPQELKDCRCWLVAKLVPKADGSGIVKKPWDFKVDRPKLKWNEKENLLSFDAAVASLPDSKEYVLGFAFEHSPYLGIDGDSAFEGKSGLKKSFESTWLKFCVGNYCESTPSGKGFRAFIRREGPLPKDCPERKIYKFYGMSVKEQVEVFSGGFCTVTGNMFPSSTEKIKTESPVDVYSWFESKAKADEKADEAGGRNPGLLSYAGGLKKKGLSFQQLKTLVLAENENLAEPLDESSLKPMFRTIEGWYAEGGTKPVVKMFLSAKRGGSITPTCTQWLWPGFIPFRKLASGIGEPGCGKSLSVFDILAVVLSGKDTDVGAKWPDGQPNTHGPMECLLVTFSEDTYDDVVIPALMSRGCSPEAIDRLHCIDGLKDQDGRPAGGFSLDHLTSLEEYLDSNLGIRFFAINPLAAGFGSNAMNNQQEVRSALTPLAELVDRRNLADWLVHHDKKGLTGSAVEKASGSQQILGTIRCAFHYVKGKNGRPHSMASSKMNLSGATGLKFEIYKAPHPLGPEADLHDIGIGRIKWLGRQTKTADELLAEQQDKEESKQAKCEQYIKVALKDHPKGLPREDFYEWATGLDGTPDSNAKAMQRAAKALGIDNKKKIWDLRQAPATQEGMGFDYGR